jgi:short-subunit dehydrogenase
MWLSSRAVAEAGVAGLERGRPVVIPGTPNRVMANLSAFIPRRLLLPVLASRHPALRDR